MNLSTTSIVKINNREVRVLSHHFNQAVKHGLPILDEAGKRICLSKGIGWAEASKLLRARKSVLAKVEHFKADELPKRTPRKCKHYRRNLRRGEAFRRATSVVAEMQS